MESEIVGLEEELFSDSVVGNTSDEAIPNELIDASRSRGTACWEGSQLGDKLQAVFTDVLVTSIELCSTVDCPLAGLKAIGQSTYCFIVAHVCRA